jgi:tellurium resistance protein TerD
MSFSLEKNESINLNKTDSSLTHARIGLGWTTPFDRFDLDASALLLNANGKLDSERDMVFYNNPASSNRAVTTKGDNRSGVGEGDDESIVINLEQVPDTVRSIVILVTIHKAVEREQTFGQVKDAYVRIINDNTGHSAELARFDLGENASSATCVVFGTIHRAEDNTWSFTATGEGHNKTLTEMARTLGLPSLLSS